MERKHDVNEINLAIDSIYPFHNEKYEGIIIEWVADIGFGQYTIYKSIGEKQWYAESEYMDTNEDKSFLKKLLNLIADKVIIEQ